MVFRDILFAPALRGYVHLHLDGGPTDQLLNLNALLDKRSNDCHLYFCGPTGFMLAVERAAHLVWPTHTLHKEYFSPPAPTGHDRPFLLQLARSNITVEVSAGCTALEALLAHGIDVQSGCEQGVCGLCITRVFEGVVDHRDSFLSADDKRRNDKFAPCCSRAISSYLVIDL
ncbi:MAG: flavin reductase family protein [Dongiaceae bacterium]